MENLTKAQVIALPPGSKIGIYEFIEGKQHEPGEITAIRINSNKENTYFFYWVEYRKGKIEDEEDEQLIEQINDDGSFTLMYGDSDTYCQFCLLENTALYEGKIIETEDCTPTWSAIIDIHLQAIEYGDVISRATARVEIRRMAALADKYVELLKSGAIDENDL